MRRSTNLAQKERERGVKLLSRIIYTLLYQSGTTSSLCSREILKRTKMGHEGGSGHNSPYIIFVYANMVIPCPCYLPDSNSIPSGTIETVKP